MSSLDGHDPYFDAYYGDKRDPEPQPKNPAFHASDPSHPMDALHAEVRGIESIMRALGLTSGPVRRPDGWLNVTATARLIRSTLEAQFAAKVNAERKKGGRP